MNSKKSLNMIVAALITVISFVSCAQTRDPDSSSISDITETTTEQISISESETSDTSATDFTVQTEPHTNPFGSYVGELAYQGTVANICYTGDFQKAGFYYGFDNPFVIEVLRNKIYECTGETNDNATLSDVGYFQYIQTAEEGYSTKYSFGDDMVSTSENCVSVEAVRAVLSSIGLRFGIDEVPASYLIERFPRFYYDQFYGTDCYQFMDTNPINDNYDLTSMSSIREITNSNLLDVVIFKSCITYNRCRVSCMYAHPYGGAYSGVIDQVREASTGRNVLVPTQAQAECIQSDINTVPGCENIDIFEVQTLEDFYNDYGYYPDEILQLRDSVNTPENFDAYANGYVFP